MWNKFKEWLANGPESSQFNLDTYTNQTDFQYESLGKLRQTGLQSSLQYSQLQKAYAQTNMGSTYAYPAPLFEQPEWAFDMAGLAIREGLRRMRAYKDALNYRKSYQQITFKGATIQTDPFQQSSSDWYVLNDKYFTTTGTGSLLK